MPCIVKVRVREARGLPIMDTISQLTDAFVEVHFAEQDEQRTKVCRKTLNPVWNEDFRFNVNDDSLIQDAPLEFKVFDYDQVTRNDSVGVVYVDLNPLITLQSVKEIAGWFPIYDSLRGARGELYLAVKLDYIDNANPFKESSAGVLFYSSTSFPEGYQTKLLGFVEELIYADDPEYHWSDNFRSSRFSNEERQRTFSELAGKVRRLVGRKVREMGGNAVLGYLLSFDLETKVGDIVARAIGTACTILETSEANAEDEDYEGVGETGKLGTSFPGNNDHSGGDLSSGMEALELGGMSSTPENPNRFIKRIVQNAPVQNRLQELPLYTLKSFRPGEVVRLGGSVSARAVKLLISGEEKSTQQELHDSWWREVRQEIRSHARYLGCDQVVGYSELMTISEDLCVLSAFGTAVTLKSERALFADQRAAAAILMANAGSDDDEPDSGLQTAGGGGLGGPQSFGSPRKFSLSGPADGPTSATSRLRRTISSKAASMKSKASCASLHIPHAFRHESIYPMELSLCNVCGKHYVPELIITTVSPLDELAMVGSSSMIEAYLCRPKKRKDGENNAIQVSDILPFIDNDLYKQLMYKLKVKGLNAIFDLKVQVTVGDTLITAEAVGTAVYLRALAPPKVLAIAPRRQSKMEDPSLLEVYKRIAEISEKNYQQKLEAVRLCAVDTDDESGDEELLGTSPGRGGPPSSIVVNPGPRPNTSYAQSAYTDRSFLTELSGSRFERTDPSIARIVSAGASTLIGTAEELDNEDTRHNFVVHVDDDTDEDMLAVLLDPERSPAIQLHCTDNMTLLGEGRTHQFVSSQLATVSKRMVIKSPEHHPSRQLAQVFRRLQDELIFALRNRAPCVICGVKYRVVLPRDNDVILLLTASILIPREMPAPAVATAASSSSPGAAEDHHMQFDMEGENKQLDSPDIVKHFPTSVQITSLQTLPGMTIETYCDRVNLFLVKETQALHETGGSGAFLQSFVYETMAIARSHVRSRGGNALTSFRSEMLVLTENVQKNHAYVLLCVSGDVVEVSCKDPSRLPQGNPHTNWPGAPPSAPPISPSFLAASAAAASSSSSSSSKAVH